MQKDLLNRLKYFKEKGASYLPTLREERANKEFKRGRRNVIT